MFSPRAYGAYRFQNALSAWPNEDPKQALLLEKNKHLEGEEKISTEICNQVIQYLPYNLLRSYYAQGLDCVNEQSKNLFQVKFNRGKTDDEQQTTNGYFL